MDETIKMITVQQNKFSESVSLYRSEPYRPPIEESIKGPPCMNTVGATCVIELDMAT